MADAADSSVHIVQTIHSCIAMIWSCIASLRHPTPSCTRAYWASIPLITSSTVTSCGLCAPALCS